MLLQHTQLVLIFLPVLFLASPVRPSVASQSDRPLSRRVKVENRERAFLLLPISCLLGSPISFFLSLFFHVCALVSSQLLFVADAGCLPCKVDSPPQVPSRKAGLPSEISPNLLLVCGMANSKQKWQPLDSLCAQTEREETDGRTGDCGVKWGIFLGAYIYPSTPPSERAWLFRFFFLAFPLVMHITFRPAKWFRFTPIRDESVATE